MRFQNYYDHFTQYLLFVKSRSIYQLFINLPVGFENGYLQTVYIEPRFVKIHNAILLNVPDLSDIMSFAFQQLYLSVLRHKERTGNISSLGNHAPIRERIIKIQVYTVVLRSHVQSIYTIYAL